MEVQPVDGQCGTCKFAAEFCYCSTPSGPEDGVHCTSREHAAMMDSQTENDGVNIREYDQYGFLDLWRLEHMAEEEYRCPNWQQR